MGQRKKSQGVLDFEGCHKKVLPTGWLKTTEIYRLIVLEAGSPKIKVLAGLVPSEVSERESVPCLSFSLW